MKIELVAYTQANPALNQETAQGVGDLATIWNGQGTYAENVVKGDTTSSVLKDATTDTGLIVKVPAFIKTNDIIRVDTRDGSYIERQKG